MNKNKKNIRKGRYIYICNIVLFLLVAIVAGKIISSPNYKNISNNDEENTITIDYKSVISNNVSNNKVSTTSQNLILVNKNTKIAENYEPNDLIVPSIRFESVGDMMVQYVRTDVAIALEQMFKAAKEDGIKLIAISGFRSYDYQKILYNNEVRNVGEIQANRYVAKPGESEHQTGLAMDILCDEYMILDEGFENTAAFSWLENNMTKYGFILRYPEGKENITGYGYEPWHLRYVGSDVAQDIMDNNLTLEEFLSN